METGRSAARWGIVWAVRSPPRWKSPSHSARKWIHRFAREHCHRPTDSWNIYNDQTISVTATSPIGRESCRAVILSSCSPSSSAFSRHILATDHQPLVLLRSSRCTVMRSSQYTFSFRFSLFRYLTVWSRTIKKWYRAVLLPFYTIVKSYAEITSWGKRTFLLKFKLKCVIIDTTYSNLQKWARQGFWF